MILKKANVIVMTDERRIAIYLFNLTKITLIAFRMTGGGVYSYDISPP
jgi:hypothetical protein